MSNNLTTVCTMTGSPYDLARFFATHVRMSKESKEPSYEFLDFGTVIPKPECVDATSSGSASDTGFYALTGFTYQRFAWSGKNPMQVYAEHRGFQVNAFTTFGDFAEWLREHEPKTVEEGAKAVRCFRETGHKDWYDWNYANWGSRGCAYDFARRENSQERAVFQFDTANAFPEPIFRKLAELFPEAAFDVVTIDEGGPEYVGRYAGQDCRFEKVEHDPERYRLVYGRDPYTDEEDATETN